MLPQPRVTKPLSVHIPDYLRRYLPSIPPPTPRNLWLLLAAAVAVQNMSVFHTSQTPTVTVFAVLIWGGALICMEDQLETLRPRPTFIGLIFGTVLLLWTLSRTAVILHSEGVLFLLGPLAGISLTLLCHPPEKYIKFRDPLLCLLLLPSFALLMRVLPEKPISLATAQISGMWLSSLGFSVLVSGRNVYLPGGGVEVLGPCNGLDMMAQILCVAVIFILAFPVRSTLSRITIFLAAPLLGLLCNTIRISILAYIVSTGNGKGSTLFDFFHTDGGSLIFSGVAVFAFGSLYMYLLERELPPIAKSE